MQVPIFNTVCIGFSDVGQCFFGGWPKTYRNDLDGVRNCDEDSSETRKALELPSFQALMKGLVSGT